MSEFLPERFLAQMGENLEVVYDPDLYAERPRLLREVAQAEAIMIRNRTRIDSELLESAKAMKVVGRLGVGLDNIDMDACSAAGVTVIPAVGGNALSVAEYVMAAMLVLRRGVFGMTESMIAGQWPRQGHAFGHEMMGSTLGLVGFGSIGRHVASRSAAMGMTVVAHDPYVGETDPAWQLAERVGLDQLLADADVVSLHIPYNQGTAGLIGEAALARMKSSAVLINTSRGGIVDEPALAAALRDGVIGGAAMDVFESEPLDP
ncbi:MAG: NAD(P)-dependent oxidoreductase, partial [Acidimicrobiia bacterium]